MAGLGLEIIELLGLVSVASLLTFALASELTLLLNSQLHGALQVALLTLKTGLLVSSSEEVSVGTLVGLSSSSQVEFTSFSLLAKFVSSLLSLEKFVIKTLNSLIRLSIFTLLERVKIAETVDFFLVAGTLFLKLLQLEVAGIKVFSQTESLIRLLLNFALVAKDLGLASRDLVSDTGNFSLHVVILSVFLVKKEAHVVNFLALTLNSDEVRVMTGLEVVILKQLLILEVSVFGLNVIKLISQLQVILVSLLDFKNLCFQL